MYLALVTHHAKRMRHIILSSAVSGSTRFFRILSQPIQHKICLDFPLELLSEVLLSLSRIQTDIINVHASSYKIQFILLRC